MHTNAGFASLEKANPEQLSKFFLGEHPQTTALILAHLNSAHAAQVLEQLPDDMRAEVLMRMASLGEIPPDVIARVSSRHRAAAAQPRRPLARAARRRARGRGALQLSRSQREPAGARADRSALARHGGGDPQSDVRLRRPGRRRRERHPRNRQSRRQEDADRRAQGRERADSRSGSSRTCRSAPSIS